MKTLQNYIKESSIRESSILEAKDDNLHEFIQYLHDHSKRGTLKSKYKKDEIYPQFIADCSIERFHNKEYKYDMVSLKDLLI